LPGSRRGKTNAPSVRVKPEDLPGLLKAIFDKIWRSAGFERCWYFDD